MGKKWRYGVIIDAGSSGSRLHVYRWKNHARAVADASVEELRQLPRIKTKWTKKIRPGISTFGERPAAVGPEHLQQLVDYALEVVPADMVADTPIYIMATAGMRLLPAAQQTAVLQSACAFLRQTTDFALPDADAQCRDSIQVIAGETEGLFGWLAANYLLGGFDTHQTFGFLDMGGASAQIAFAPNRTEAAEHADALTLVRLRTLDGQLAEHRVFSATWLGFGVNQAREAYVAALAAEYDAAIGTVYDPCLPRGLQTTLDGEVVTEEQPGTRLLVGTGDFAQCLLETKPLLGQDETCGGHAGAQPCLIHDAVPSIDFRINRFVGVSEYYHSTHGFFGEKGGDHAYDFSAYQRNVKTFCERDWADIAAGISGKKHTLLDAQQACFKASWVINVLHEGIGIPRVDLERLPGFNVSRQVLEDAKDLGFVPGATAFQPVDKIDSVEVSWTLGRMLLYAAGQVPPAEAGSSSGGGGGGSFLEVGFGSNVKGSGTPADFTYAGSTWRPVSQYLGRPRRFSSGLLLFFLLLLLVAAFVLRRRERRLRLFARISALVARQTGWRVAGSPRHKSGNVTSSWRRLMRFANQLFGSAPRVDYERVLEEGNGAFDQQFELDDADYDTSDSGSSSRGSALSALDRSGLVVRTESRDRLAAAHVQIGRRSRAGSPTRLKSPMMAPVQED